MANNDNNDSQIKCPQTTQEQQQQQVLSNESSLKVNHDEKPLLLLINPHSGKGNSVSIYERKILPFLRYKQIEHKVFITETDLRVEQYLKNRDLFEFKSIIVVSGDGLFFETLNSIMKHQNWKKIIGKIPMGVIPTGSGNGLAYTLLRQNKTTSNHMNEDEAIKICCEQSIQDRITMTDLVKITIENKQSIIWSFLSTGWGLLSDIDIDSEWLRSVGLLRFTIYGLLRSLTSVAYSGRLSYEPVSMDREQQINNLLVDTKLNKTGTTNKHKGDTETDTASNQIDNDDGDDDDKNDITNWVHIEDKFACVYAVYQSYISSVTKFAPTSTLTDQIIYLTYVRGNLNPCQIVKFLLAIENGSHGKLPFVNVVPVKRLKLEPLEESRIVVDGEVIPWTTSDGPISLEIVPKVLKLRWNSNLSF